MKISTQIIGKVALLASIVWGGISSVNFAARKTKDALVDTTREAVNGVVEKVVVPAASEVIGEAVKEVVLGVEKEVIKEQLFPGYHRLMLKEQRKHNSNY